MPTLLDPSIEVASLPLEDTDLLYLVRGTGVDRDKKTTVAAVRQKLSADNLDLTGIVQFARAPGGTRLGIGAVSSGGGIPLYPLDDASPSILVNAGYVYLGLGFLVGTNPTRWTVISMGTGTQVGITDAPTPVYTGVVGGALTAHTPGIDFAINGRIIECIWDGATLYMLIMAT